MDASIVIATRDRRELLKRTLRSIEMLSTGARFEVIIADHGSADGTAEMLDAFDTLPLQRIEVPFRHASIAEPKNAGATAASGRILIFLDCGMICPPEFLTAHLSVHESVPGTLLAGSVVGWDCEDESDPFWATLDTSGMPTRIPDHLVDPRSTRWAACAETPWLLVWGANMSLSRRAFLGHGGFDTAMRGWGWDDLELAFRLADAGIPPRYSPDAWALHYPHTRAPMDVRLRNARANWLLAYDRHRAPALETWDVCEFWRHTQCLRRLHDAASRLHPLPSPPRQQARPTPRVLFGFAATEMPGPHDTFIVLPGHTGSGPQMVRSFGLRTWLPDGHATVALASPALLAFDWSPAPDWPSIAQWILVELGRLSPTVRIARAGQLAPAELTRLYDLAAAAQLPDFGSWEEEA